MAPSAQFISPANGRVYRREMKNQLRLKMLIYLTLMTAGMLLLAASLSGLQFQPGIPIPGAETSPEPARPLDKPGEAVFEARPLLQLPLALLFLSSLVMLLAVLVKKGARKQVFKWAGVLVVVACLYLLLNQIEVEPSGSAGEASQESGSPPVFFYDAAPIGEPPEKLYQLAAAVLILGAAALAAWLVARRSRPLQGAGGLALEAEDALHALGAGEALGGVIIRCYLQMEKIVREERGIERAASLTPREFSAFLAAQGIHLAQIKALTALFEKARYGREPLNQQDEQAALECLAAVRGACGEGGRGGA